eukprot:COSAG02_NODE_45609_length_355_cov_1.328125_1_plen_36_part_10
MSRIGDAASIGVPVLVDVECMAGGARPRARARAPPP